MKSKVTLPRQIRKISLFSIRNQRNLSIPFNKIMWMRNKTSVRFRSPPWGRLMIQIKLEERRKGLTV